MDWKKAIEAVAPKLAKAIGGPLGSAAVGAIAGALGVDPSEDAIAKKVETMTAGDFVKLKEAEQGFATEMRKLDVDELRVASEDTANARSREIQLHDWVNPVLAIGVFALFSFVVFHLQRASIPVENRDAFNQVLGILYAAVTGVLGYYFGSSLGSRDKDRVRR